MRKFNAPPGWPTPPEGWEPAPGWSPDPAWPPAPPDWTWWIEIPAPDAAAPAFGSPAPWAYAPFGTPNSLPRALWVALAAAIAVAIGTLLPWASVLIFSVNGTQTGDGRLVLGGAVIAGIFFGITWRASGPSRLYLIGGAFGLGSFGVSIYDIVRILTADQGTFFGARVGASPGSGLWIDVIAGAVLVGAVIKHWRDTR